MQLDVHKGDHNDRKSFMPLDTEAQFFEIWQKELSLLAPTEMARLGGHQADRLAWVFVSGYQAAMRWVFPDLNKNSWAAYCVSEGVDGKPPVVASGAGEEKTLNGFKTWVAASEQVRQLVIKVDRGVNAFYVTADRDLPGVNVTTPKPASFLKEMGQGLLELKDVPVNSLIATGTERLKLFTVVESLYIYLAFVGLAEQRGIAEATPIADRLIRYLYSPDANAEGLQEIAAIDLEVQNLLKTFEQSADTLPLGWHDDKRLIQMYSPMIQRRVQTQLQN